MTASNKNLTNTKSHYWSAVFAALPLSFAVIPWGILCATLCIQIGMSPIQAQMMSLLVFAGAAQISGTAILGSATGSWLGLLNSTLMISFRHVLYSATYKESVSQLPFWKRLIFAFLLTDEMFAIAQTKQSRTGTFDYWYSVIAGFSFYVAWNIATFAGILFAQRIPSIDDVDEMGFDFAIVATFIAMVVPMIKQGKEKRRVLFVATFVSAFFALLCELLHVKNGLILSGLIGMTIGAVLNTVNTSTSK